jgi:hypothetical protein
MPGSSRFSEHAATSKDVAVVSPARDALQPARREQVATGETLVRVGRVERLRAGAYALLAQRRAVVAIIGFSMLLTSPYLFVGGNGDDYAHTISMREAPELALPTRPPWDLFSFATPESSPALLEQGVAPWWTDPELTISFYRPLSSLLRWVDHLLWPEDMVLMHLHSLVWFGLLLAAVAVLYRSMAPSPRHAVLALLLFALDDARAGPVAWVAQRNALVALVPAVLALAAHHRWRAHGSRACARLAPGALFVALQGGEAALSVCGYLLAYALVLERSSWWVRLRSLSPYLLVLLLWAVVYLYQGRGAQHSGIYIEPIHAPLQYLRAVLERLPILLLSEFALPVSDLWEVYPLITSWMQPAVYGFAVLVLGGLWLLVRPLAREQPVLRFWLLGTLLASLPACCVHPQDRMLTVTSLGGAALIAALLLRVLSPSDAAPSRLVKASMAALAFVHLVLAPLLLPLRHFDIYAGEQLTARADRSVPSGPEIAQQSVILVNPPVDIMAVNFLVFRVLRRVRLPKHFRALATGESDLYVERVDERTLRLKPANGFLATGSQILFRRPDRSLHVGDSVRLSDVEYQVTAATADGRPAQVDVHFAEPLESHALRFMQWGKYEYVPFTPPAVGQAVVIPRVEPADLIESPFARGS